MSLSWILLGLSAASASEPVATPKIINGTQASADEYPMTGAMMLDATLSFGGAGSQDIRILVCSSTLIAPDVVLLAAHCVDPYPITFGFGELSNVDFRWTRETDLSAHDGSGISDWPADNVRAWDWVMHPNWDIEAMEIGIAKNNDIALLFLDEPILDVEPAYLIADEEVDQLVEGSEVDVVGWGQQVATDLFESPPAGTYGLKYAGTSWVSELGEFEFQVGANEDDVRKCHGDSGGPSFLEIDTESAEPMRLVGVTSHAYDETDCDSTGGVDTRVDAFLGWIEAEMVSRCEDGSRSWCEEYGILKAPLSGDDDLEGEDPVGACACASSSGKPLSGLAWLPLVLGWIGWRRKRLQS